MNRLRFFISDFKQLIREPMMLILFLAPILIAGLMRLLYVFLVPLIERYISFEIALYDSYILSMVLLFTPMMLGVVMGFMMLDDKDAKIVELMSITPLGKSGYLKNRLSFIMIPSMIYTFINYYIMQIYIINFITLAYISFISSLLSIVIGLVFSSIATDKIKGLTYAKGLNLLIIFAFGDLFKGNSVKYLSSAFPTYWISKIIATPNELKLYAYTLIIIMIWLLLFINNICIW
ncbi:MAG: hypothetical protein WBA54_12745 [Acidaminobacteraceae bacterium]